MKTQIKFLLILLPLFQGCAAFTGRVSEETDTLSSRAYGRAVARHDLILGMNPSEVEAAWGHPTDIEVAGQKGAGFERWVYSTSMTQAAFQSFGTRKRVYFEEGKVVGWETL